MFTSDNNRVQIFCKTVSRPAPTRKRGMNGWLSRDSRPLRSRCYITHLSRKHTLSLLQIIIVACSLMHPPGGKGFPEMPFAPLRRITERHLTVWDHRRGFPAQFAVVDTLECGHALTLLGWTLLDLVNPYTENAEVAARRHRCRACMRIAQERKTHAETVPSWQTTVVGG